MERTGKKDSIDKLLLITTVVLIVLSFDPVRYQNDQWDLCLKAIPNLFLFVPGTVFLVYFLWRNRKLQLREASTKRIEDGYRLKLNSNHSISVVTGKIENFTGGKHAAVVLPANTSFDDQCIHDNRSALGSFFMRHFPSGIDEIQKLIRDTAIKACGKTEQTFNVAPSGTTILLDKPLGSAFRILVTAVTTVDPEQGITADTLSLLSSVKQVFRRASQNRISSVTMPLIGTGHGCLDFKAALSLLLVQCMYSMQHKGTHHVREATIVIYDPENKKKDIVTKVIQAVGNLTQI